MTLNDFITDYPNEFQECVSDIDWHTVFKLIDDGELNELAIYLDDHFESYKQGLMPQDGPNHDAEYDLAKQMTADLGFNSISEMLFGSTSKTK